MTKTPVTVRPVSVRSYHQQNPYTAGAPRGRRHLDASHDRHGRDALDNLPATTSRKRTGRQGLSAALIRDDLAVPTSAAPGRRREHGSKSYPLAVVTPARSC